MQRSFSSYPEFCFHDLHRILHRCVTLDMFGRFLALHLAIILAVLVNMEQLFVIVSLNNCWNSD